MSDDFDSVMERFRKRAAERIAEFEKELDSSHAVVMRAQREAAQRKTPQSGRPVLRRRTAVQGVLRSQRG